MSQPSPLPLHTQEKDTRKHLICLVKAVTGTALSLCAALVMLVLNA